MPRIRPARTQEEVNAIAADKSVTIELQPEGTVILDKDQDALDQAQLEAEAKKKAQAKPKKEEPEPQEDDPADLKQQLVDLRKANEEQRKRFDQEVSARQAAEQREREREKEAGQSQIRAEDAEYNAILNAIGAAESEAESAQRDIASATEASDSKTVAEASRRLARAEARLSQLEDGKAAIERAKTNAAAQARNQPVQQQNQAPTVEQYIENLPNLLPSQRNWLKEHPDSLTDNRKNLRLQGAHVEAEDKGLRPGTQKYFSYLEERLGYAEPEEDDQVQDNDDRPAASVQAPPSRAATNPGTGRQSNSRITLTPEQREIARLSGIDEITYARNLQKMNEAKASGQLQ